MYLQFQLGILLALAARVEVTHVNIISARSICASSTEDVQLLCKFIVGDSRWPARLGPPASLGDGWPLSRGEIQKHYVVKACARYLVVNGILHSWRIDIHKNFAVGVTERVVILATIDEHVFVLRDENGLVVAPRKWLNTCRLFAEEIDWSLVSLRYGVTWPNRHFNLVGLRLVDHDILRNHFNQIVRWYKSTICLLYKAAKHVWDVVVGLVSVPQLLGLTTEGANGMMTALQKPSPLLRVQVRGLMT